MSDTAELDAFLAAFREDWVKAGAPTPTVVISMVNEIERLRRALAMGAPGAWDTSDRTCFADLEWMVPSEKPVSGRNA